MGRRGNPLYPRKIKIKGSTGKPETVLVYCVRWYKENGRRKLLSLGTSDPIEAMKRVPIVSSTGRSWADYQKTLRNFNKRPTCFAREVAGVKLEPALEMKSTDSATIQLIEEGIKAGQATYDPVTGVWNVLASAPTNFIDALTFIREKLSKSDNRKEIENFYTISMPELFIDKKTAERQARLWLDFLKRKEIIAWDQITEVLVAEFRDWRKKTPLETNGRTAKPPSILVVNRHMHFLSKSFDEARERGLMKFNPIRNWKPEAHHTPLQQSLTVKELHKVLSHPRWQQDFMMNGSTKVPLSFKLIDLLLILFTSCKRRGEIIKLKIQGVDFKHHWVYYEETKNCSKGTLYIISKAFWLTPLMERLLKRVIGDRTSGPVFQCPEGMKKMDMDDDNMNADYLSQVWSDVVKEIVPNKKVPLKNLRQTATDILENAGCTDAEMDATLGHIDVKTALPNYQNRSEEAVARRLSGRTRKGIEILCGAAKDFF